MLAIEHLQKDAVIEYLQMPERVKNVEVQVGELRGYLLKLTEALGRLCNLDDDGQPPVFTGEGGKSYVS